MTLRLARERNWTAPEGTHSRSNGAAAETSVSPEAAAGPRPEDQPGKESQAVHTDDSRKED